MSDYSLKWNRSTPGHIVYLVDLSGSMGRQIDGAPLVNTVLKTIARLFRNLSAQCEVKGQRFDYFSVSVYGYNSDVEKLLIAPTAIDFCRFVDESRSKDFIFDPTREAKPQWQTYMADAFDTAATDIRQWLERQKAAGKETPAPVVINITDGFPCEDGLTEAQAMAKALEASKRLRDIATPDGNVLLFNVHYSPDSSASTIAMPSSAPADSGARFLFEASSAIPPKAVTWAQGMWPGADASSRLMISNEKNPRGLLNFLNFGSTMFTGAALETPKPR